jgi:exodeoxyribonuclease V alpha subunit
MRTAKTIHRLLEFNAFTGGFSRNDKNPLETDVVIIDEMSMIDTILMYHLVKAIPDHAVLILVGDVNQLPSVGPGNVLNDIISSGTFPVVRLTKIFRQAQESLIVVNAHRINQGFIPWLKKLNQETLSDFYFISQEDPASVVNIILELVNKRIPERFGFDPIEDIQVLVPMHQGIAGIENINSALQNVLNSNTDGISRAGKFYKAGDKVMQIKNNYTREVFNGDIGRIRVIDKENQEMMINFDGRDLLYDFADLDEVVPAYAISIHKSQGSEYPVVVIPILTQHFILLQRNLVYTAITRGKKLVVLVGTVKALSIAVRNNKTQKRFTMLKRRLNF